MRAKHAGESLEGLELRAHRESSPTGEEAVGPARRPVAPELLKLLFEEVGPNRSEVDAHQVAQANPLTAAEVLWTFEQEPSGLGEYRSASGAPQRSHFVAPNLVDGLAEVLGDVEAIEDVNGGRAAAADDIK